MPDFAAMQAIVGDALGGGAPPAVAPSVANPTGWAPPAGAAVNIVPTIDVGGAAGAPVGQPGSEFAAVPAPAPGPTDTTPPGHAPVVGPDTAAGAPARPPGGVGPVATAVINQLRAAQGQPIHAFGQDWSGPLAAKIAAMQRGIAEPAYVPGAPKPGAGQTTGLIANIGAGTSEGVAQLLGLPVQIANTLANLPVEAANALLDRHFPLPFNPAAGTQLAERAEGLIGANPQDVVPSTPGQALAREAAAGATSMVVPGLAAEAIPATAIPILEAARGGFAAGASPVGAAMGAGGAVAGQEAANAVPAPYEPFAAALANIAGGAAIGLGAAGAVGAGRAAMGTAERLGIGRAQSVIDPATGDVLPATPTQPGEPGRPLTATAAQQASAGRRIAAAAGQNPADLAASLTPQGATAGAPANDQTAAAALGGAGYEPSLGQARGNYNLIALERRLRVKFPAMWNAIDSANQMAVASTVRGLTAGEAAESVGDFVRSQLAALREGEEEAARRADQTGTAETGALGGAPANTNLTDVATTGLERLDLARRAAKVPAQRALNAMDPDGTLALSSGEVGDTAVALGSPSPSEELRLPPTKAQLAARAAINPDGAIDLPLGNLAPGEADVLADAAAMRGKVVSFKALNDLSGRVAAVQRDMRVNLRLGAESVPYRRMSFLRDAIERAMWEGAAEEAAAEVNGAPRTGAGSSGSQPAAPVLTAAGRGATEAMTPATGTAVFTPGGQRIEVQYALRPIGDLITSHGDDLEPNRAFPAEMQPRNRSAAASRQQVQHIAANLRPEELGASASTSTGAPIVGPDGIVESGNGRTIALRRALAAGGDAAERYRAWVKTQFPEAGPNDVMVRVRQTPMDHAARVEFTHAAGAFPTLAMGAAETAMADAARLPQGVLELWHGGDIHAPQNREFVRAFARTVPHAGEEGGLLTSEGGLSLDGERRIENALLARAYGDPRLIQALAERGDESIRAIGPAMMDAAGSMAKLRMLIERGDVDPGMNISGAMLEALRTISAARARRLPLGDLVGQADMMGGGVSDGAQRILRLIFGDNLKGRASRSAWAETLERYAESAQSQTAGPRLFGENATSAELLESARNAVTGKGSNRPGGASPGASFGGGGAQSGGQAGGPAIGPSGGEPGAASQGIGITAPEPAASPELTANFSPEKAAQRRAANALYAAYKAGWRRGPVGEALASGNLPGGFHLSPTAALAKLWRPGPAGGEGMGALVRVTGPGEAAAILGDLPAYQLRVFAERNGVLDPKLAQKWIDSHREALNQVPELRAKFQNATTAIEAANEAAATAHQARVAFERSAAGKLLGADPQTAVQRLLAAPNPEAAARELLDQLGSSPGAVAGMRREVGEWLLGKAQSTREAGFSGERELAKANLQRVLANPKQLRALRVLMTPAGLDLVQEASRALDVLARAQATGMRGSPATALDWNAATHGAPPSLLAQGLIGEALGEAAGHFIGAASGPWGAMLRVAGGAFGVLHRAMETAGIGRVDQLIAEGLAHPNTVGRALAERAAASDKAPILRALTRRIGALGIAGYAASQNPGMPKPKGVQGP